MREGKQKQCWLREWGMVGTTLPTTNITTTSLRCGRNYLLRVFANQTTEDPRRRRRRPRMASLPFFVQFFFSSLSLLLMLVYFNIGDKRPTEVRILAVDICQNVKDRRAEIRLEEEKIGALPRPDSIFIGRFDGPKRRKRGPNKGYRFAVYMSVLQIY